MSSSQTSSQTSDVTEAARRDPAIRKREAAAARQRRHRGKLLRRVWGGKVGACVHPCPWRNDTNMSKEDAHGPLCGLQGARRGEPCKFEVRLFNDAVAQLEQIYSPTTASMLASLQVRVLRARAMEIEEVLGLEIRLVEATMQAELRARSMVLKDERARRRLALQEKKLLLEGKSRPSNSDIIASALAKARDVEAEPEGGAHEN